ncbi:hypothetical protein [Marisediminicola senii]|uniref:hypothetical protein n=1 Tax=Marisediminicola senii TaxID=2711233 RepID=UPI0013EC0F10|nr:hypothetical protein [Marisediminicola senii]
MPITRYPLSPDVVPVLARGKHRNPRRGACFMEYASFLAGEKWSDHPACTHPAVATVARLVNDWTTDRGRSRLAPLVPSVVGLGSNGSTSAVDERLHLLIAVRAAASALPVASEGRQRALAVALLRCETRAATVDPAAFSTVEAIVDEALVAAPLATRWAEQQLAALAGTIRQPVPMYDAIVTLAVAGIGEACMSDPDARLYELLRSVIDDSTRILTPEAGSPARAATLLPA